MAISTCHCQPSARSARTFVQQGFVWTEHRETDTFIFYSYSSASFSTSSLLRSCSPVIRRENILAINNDLSVFNKRLHTTSTPWLSYHLLPPLSISALSAGHPITAVAPNFDLPSHNSRLWLTRSHGGRTRAQYTGLQGIRQKNPQEFCCIPATQPVTVFSQPHTEKKRGKEPFRQ